MALITISAILGAIALLAGRKSSPPAAPPVAPRTPTQAALAAIHAVERRVVQRKILEAWARLETGNFRSIHGKSLYNIHVGSGAGDWNRKTAGTDGGAPLRDYDSFEQSVRDVLLLMRRVPSIYGKALEHYEAGRVGPFFEALARGNGREGFVGPAVTPKADGYIAGLNRVYREVA